MKRFTRKIWGLIALGFFVCTSLFAVGDTKAAEVLPKGGSDFSDAVELEPGSYETGSTDTKEYFYVDGIKPGQEIELEGTFIAASKKYGANPILYLYNEDREELGGSMEAAYENPAKIAISKLQNADEESYKFYLKAGTDYSELASYSLKISVTDYFDAGSQTDAGDTFDQAMPVDPGEYEGYLASYKSGTDSKDFYAIKATKGTPLTVKATPCMGAYFSLVVYDSNKQQLASTSSSNPGAILTISPEIEKSEDLFVEMSYLELSDKSADEDQLDYTLVISAEEGEETDDGESTAGDGGAGGPLDGLNWPLIAGGILLLVALIIAVALLIKKGKDKQQQSSQ